MKTLLNNIFKTFGELFCAVISIKIIFGFQEFFVAGMFVSPDPVYSFERQFFQFLLLDTLSFIPAISYMIIYIYLGSLKNLNLENNSDVLELHNEFSLDNTIKYIGKILLIYIAIVFVLGFILPGGIIGTLGNGFLIIAIIWLFASMYKILITILITKKVLFALFSSAIFYLSQLCILRIILYPILKEFLFVDLTLLIIIVSLISTPLFFVPYLSILDNAKNLGDVYKCIIKSKNIVKNHIIKYFFLNFSMLLSLSVIFTPIMGSPIIVIFILPCLFYMSYFINKISEILKDEYLKQ